MAGSRTPDTEKIRIFMTVSASDLTELDDVGFGDEGQLHKLIESNMSTLFRDLTFLKQEF